MYFIKLFSGIISDKAYIFCEVCLNAEHSRKVRRPIWVTFCRKFFLLQKWFSFKKKKFIWDLLKMEKQYLWNERATFPSTSFQSLLIREIQTLNKIAKASNICDRSPKVIQENHNSKADCSLDKSTFFRKLYMPVKNWRRNTEASSFVDLRM